MEGRSIRPRTLCWVVGLLLLLQTVHTQAGVSNTVEVTLNKDDVFSIPFATLFPTLATTGSYKFQTNVTKIPVIEGVDKGAVYLKIIPQEFADAGAARTDVTVSAIQGDTTTKCNVSINVLGDTIGRPEVDRAIRRFDAPFLRDSFVKFPVESELFTGNGLQIKGDIVGAKGKPIGLMGYQSYTTDLALTGFSSVTERNIKSFHIGNDYLLAIDSKHHLHIFNCHDPSPLNINCRRIATVDTEIDEQSKFEVSAAGRMSTNSYYIIIRDVTKNTDSVYFSRGSSIFIYSFGAKVISADGLVTLGVDESDPAMQPTVAIITEDSEVVLVQYSVKGKKFFKKEGLVPKSICARTVFSVGDNELYVEGRCPDVQGVYAYDLASKSTDKKKWQRTFPVGDKIVQKVCFYEDSLLVARQNETDRELYLTNLRPDQDRNETFLLPEYGFTGDWTLDCVSDNRLFAVRSYDSDSKKYKYGIFDALSSGKALKRLIAIMNDQEFELSSYGRNGDLILAGFQSPGAIVAYTTFADGPQLFVDANGTPADRKDSVFGESGKLKGSNSTTEIEVPFSLMLTLTDYKKHQIQLPFVSSVVYQSKEISVNSRKTLDSTVGTFKLSSAATVSGAVRSVTLKQKDNSQAAVTDVEVQEGLSLQSKLPITVTPATETVKYGLPEFLATADDHTVVGSQSKDEVDTTTRLEIFKDQKFLYNVVISPTNVSGFSAFKTAKSDSVWVVFGDHSFNSPKKGRLNLVQLEAGKQIYSISFPSPQLRKIKVVQTGNSIIVLGFSKPEGLTIWTASVSAPGQMALGGKIPKAIDCSAYNDGTALALMCITRRALEYLKYPIDEKGVVASTPSGKVAPEYPDPRYMFLDVSSKETADHIYLISNTPSAYITETRVSKKDLKFEQKTHFKLSYHEVGALAYSGGHIVASTYTSRFGLKIHELHTWRSAFMLAGTGQLSYATSLSNRSFVGEQKFDFSLPLVTRDDTADQSMAGLAFVPYLDNKEPQLHTYKVDEISVVFKSEKVDTEALVLEFQGMTAQNAPLSSFFKPGAALKGSKWSWLWWTLVFVTMILMILACFLAVIYYKRDDKSVYDNADNNEYSLSKMGDTIGPHSAHNKHSVKGSVHDQDENMPA